MDNFINDSWKETMQKEQPKDEWRALGIGLAQAMKPMAKTMLTGLAKQEITNAIENIQQSSKQEAPVEETPVKSFMNRFKSLKEFSNIKIRTSGKVAEVEIPSPKIDESLTIKMRKTPHRYWKVVAIKIPFMKEEVKNKQSSQAVNNILLEPQGWVNDFANVIDPTYKNKINSLILEVERKTTSEIAVVTVESIAPYDEKEYARALFEKWGIGKKGKDNGILVLLAVKERRWRIETGYGIESILPDRLCGEIGQNYMVPYFKEGKYSEGLYYGVAEIIRVITQDTKATVQYWETTQYKDYYNKIRNKIANVSYDNYNRAVEGEISVEMVILSSGVLKNVNIVEEESIQDQYLKSITLDAVRKCSPFSSFPEGLKYPELKFKLAISYEVK